MLRRRTAALAVVVLLALPASAVTKQISQTASGAIDATNVHYRSTLTRVTPQVHAVSWRVIDLNDEIQLLNHSRYTVTVFGYSNEPYLRILPSGDVELNQNSPAYYLNRSFFAAGVQPPPNATATATPAWTTVSKTGQFIWHDHRIHYFSTAVPFEVKNVDKTTLVQHWTVPFELGTTRGALHGKLVWIGEKPFAFPLGAIVAFLVIVSASVAFVVVVRRRRAVQTGPPREAW